MRHRKKKIVLDRHRASRISLLRNLSDSFFQHKKIKTTYAKAKALKPIVEKLINKSKINNLSTRRYLMTCVSTKTCEKLLKEIGPQYQSRKGGYTRLIKLSNRFGDNAEMAIIELI